MADNGNSENLRKLKEAILSEADSYISTLRIEDEPQKSPQIAKQATRSPLSEDLTQTISKIDEYLEKLNAEVRMQSKQKKIHTEESIDFLIEDISIDSSIDRCESRSSISTVSNDSQIDVKSILKQKILDSAAKKINCNESSLKYFRLKCLILLFF